jgi:hypothetical protein
MSEYKKLSFLTLKMESIFLCNYPAELKESFGTHSATVLRTAAYFVFLNIIVCLPVAYIEPLGE